MNKYEVKGGSLPVLKVTMNKGSKIFSDKGDMIWQSENILMQTSTRGGLLKGLGRSFSGESMFLNTFESKEDNQEIAFAPSVPGSIKLFELKDNQSIIAQKNSFMMGEEGIELKVAFTKKITSGLLGGEGFILQKISGKGVFALEIDGHYEEKDLKEGETLLVDQGHVAFFTENVKYEIVTVKGIKNKLLGGEGLFLVKLTGPGKVGLQSMPVSSLAGEIRRFIPSK